jgi:hypothetical protein
MQKTPLLVVAFLVAIAVTADSKPKTPKTEEVDKNTITLNAEGKIVSTVPVFKPSLTITIKLVNAQNGSNQKQANCDPPLDERYQVFYRYGGTVEQPLLLDEKDSRADSICKNSSCKFTIPNGAESIIYNFLEKTHCAEGGHDGEIDNLLKEGKKLRDKIEMDEKLVSDLPLSKQLATLKGDREKLKAIARDDPGVAAIKAHISQIDEEIAFLTSQVKNLTDLRAPSALPDVQALNAQIRTKHEKRLKAEQELPDAKLAKLDSDISSVQNQLDQDPLSTHLAHEKSNLADTQAKLAKLQDTSRDNYIARKLGVIPTGPARKSVYYRLERTIPASGSNNYGKILLELIGDYPVFMPNDQIYAIIVNRRPVLDPYPFYLVVNSTIAPLENLTPVRPSATITPAYFFEAAPKTPLIQVADATYTDLLLPFDHPAKGNEQFEVTIKTHAKIVSKDVETTTNGQTTQTLEKSDQEYALVDKVKYPKAHQLYRFNFTTGVIFSNVRDPDFARVQIQPDDPNTKDVNEARFKTEEIEGNRQILPILGISFYFKRVDPEVPVSWKERLTPALLLGFTPTNPKDNLVFGGSNEVYRNVQFIWGVHVGKIKQLKAPSSFETSDSTDPATIQRFKTGFFWGVSFNLPFLNKVFGIS